MVAAARMYYQWPPHVKKCPADFLADFPTPMAEFPTPIANFFRSGVVTKKFAPKFGAEWSDPGTGHQTWPLQGRYYSFDH